MKRTGPVLALLLLFTFATFPARAGEPAPKPTPDAQEQPAKLSPEGEARLTEFVKKLHRGGGLDLGERDIPPTPEIDGTRLPAFEWTVMQWRSQMTNASVEEVLRAATFRTKQPLHDLYYDVDITSAAGLKSTNWVASVKIFQEKLGHKPTGELTVAEHEEAKSRSSQLRMRTDQVLGYGFFHADPDPTSIHAVGQLELINDAIAEPVNSCTVTAYRGDSRGIVFDYLAVDHNTVFPQQWSYKVISWDTNQVIGVRDRWPVNRTEQVIINFHTGEVHVIATNSGKETNPNPAVPPLKEPILMRLVTDTSAILKARASYWREQRANAENVIPDRVRGLGDPYLDGMR
ncbi:MAG TPA: hypothetical protein DCM86_15320 [Verrucomicrobiales bacterium]|nr:hypothetical protein [Verrucomicrobiales bacterium]